MRAHSVMHAILLGSVLCLVVGLLVVPAERAGSQTPTTYYVDNTAACPGAGTEASPWCSFSVVNTMGFGPGDQILLKRGDTFTTGMFLQGSGTSSSYVTVGAYGSGAAPIIDGGDNTSFVGVELFNESYVQVEGLTIEDAETAVLVNDPDNQSGYRFLDLTLTGNAAGIQSPSGTDTGIASNILIQDVTGSGNTLSCTVSCGGAILNLGSVSNVLVNRLYSYTNCGETNWGLGQGASDVIVENSESLYDGDCHDAGGTTANYIDNDSNVTFVNDIIVEVPQEVIDQSAIDIEPTDGPDSGINIEDDYIANNAGSGIELNDWPSPITNVTISGNVLSDNGADTIPIPWVQTPWAQIWTASWIAGTTQATGSISNNLYNAPTGTGGFEADFSANFSGFTQSNNIDASGPDNIWYAANGFGCSNAQGANQWSYQSSADGSTWTNLSGCEWVNPLDQEWSNGGTSGGFVSNFEELPPSTSTSWVARSWTAPSTGSVSIRGRVLMSDPTCASGATAEITENGSSTPIWGPTAIAAGDDVGVNADLDGVRVNAGAVLHFAVQENGSGQCRVSWTPSIGYPNPVTSVVYPAAGTLVSGSQLLDATATDTASPVAKVQYLVTGGSLNDSVVATVTTPTLYGWIANWESTSVPSGTYSLQSEVTDAAGNVAYSAPVTIEVDNPSTTVLDPSNASAVTGSQVTLTASASDPYDGVNGVSFELSGGPGPGSLNDAPIATATQGASGWSAQWNSTTVPDGTYTLQSVATDAAGIQGVSAPSTVLVENTAPATNVLVPSNGATVSGTAATLDASTSGVGVTKVEFTLTGGSLNGASIATGTLTQYGWLASWNSATVPNGTYTLESEAFDGAGLEGTSAPVTIVVDNPIPTTSVLIPSNGASVSGSQVVLDAAASDSVAGVAKVEFFLSGGSLDDVPVATAGPTEYGWLASWNSTTVPDGTYTLESEAFDPAGDVGTSSAVTIVVANPLPTTSVLIPSNGASVSGSQVLLDAAASDSVAGVAKVEFFLSGGSLDDVPIATAGPTEYGWLASWNSTTVPDGTYTLQSEAFDPAGDVGVGPAISITVAN
jgi:major membrane immunogen (membrane-anchored lipoprotein)